VKRKQTSHLSPSSVTLRFAATALALSLAVPAGAQLLEEVVVTAQKREESIQDVGIAVTAFTGEQLDAFGFTESTQISAMTPGVFISGNNGGTTQQFTIRGSTQNDFADIAEGPNAVYIDEAYMALGQS
jgi:iron complex outermembrane receptor protein